jgi:hypothetical protein
MLVSLYMSQHTHINTHHIVYAMKCTVTDDKSYIVEKDTKPHKTKQNKMPLKNHSYPNFKYLS